MCRCQCHAPHHDGKAPARRSGGFMGTLFKLVVLYVALVFGGGTLINTGHPVAVEAGKLLHMVTFVEPSTETTMRWCSPSGPTGMGCSVPPTRVRSGPAPVGSVWHVAQANKSSSSRRGGR